MAAPSAWVMPMLGIVIVESEPSNGPNPPGILLAMIAAIAPASCAFLIFVVNAQVPRSISAIRPVMAPPLVIVVQPSAGIVDATVPFRPPTVRCGPNVAALIGYSFNSEGGARMLRVGL